MENNISENPPQTRMITGCGDCPMCDWNDMGEGYTCKFIDMFSEQEKRIKESNMFQPITPEWCPLKTKDVLFKFQQ